MPIVTVLSAAKARIAKLPAAAATGRWMTRARRDNMEATPGSIIRGRSAIFAPRKGGGKPSLAIRGPTRFSAARARESPSSGEVESTPKLDRIEGAAENRRRHREQQAGGHQRPQNKHNRPLMRNEAPDDRPVRVA